MRAKIILLSFSLLFCISIYAQKSDKSTPKSMELRLNDDYSFSSNKRVFGRLNMSAIQIEDENDERNGLPPRFGYPLDVNLNTTNSGTWKVLSNGDRIWRLEIECIDAISINLLYDKFWLPNGAKLHLYSKNKLQVIGGFSSANNRGTKQNPSKFTTGLLFSESIILELFEPLSVKNQSIISVDKVIHGYREINLKNMMTNEIGHGDSGPCQVNVNCSEGQNWQNEKKGIAMILVNGTRWCSGSLINNTSNNQIPYFLTADHCIGSLDANGDSDASYYSFWWNYESSTCSQNSSDFVPESTSGATLIANNSATDFALFELTESPLDNNVDVFFNGWDRTTNPSQGGVGIHHPSGDFKKIATHNITPSPGQVWGSNTHWRVNWTQTTNGYSVTEGGSSGSPLFTNDKRIIGQLHGGSSINCADPANDPGEYGRFDVSWDGEAPNRRLRDWLDPINTNQIFLDGYNPSENLITGPSEVCSGDRPTYTLTDVPAGATIKWKFSYILNGQGTSNVQIGIFYGTDVRTLTAEVTYLGETSTFTKQISSESVSTPRSVPKIRKARNNMDFLVCCSSYGGETYTLDHAECYQNCDDLEWTYTVYFSHPGDQYYFSKSGRSFDKTGTIEVEKHTFHPLIVDAKARNINRSELCGDKYSGYSNSFSRYYGVVKKGYYRSNAFYNQALNEQVPLAYYLNRRSRTLSVKTIHIWDWLNELHLNKDLNYRDIDAIKNWLSIDNENINAFVEIRHLRGRVMRTQKLSEGTTNVSMHGLPKGLYVVRFTINNMVHHEVITY